MNADLTRLFRSAWHLLTDVPGWSEPPLKLRLRRLVPILLPFSASLLLVGWSILVHRPQIERTRANFAPLIALEQDTRQLREVCSDEEAMNLAEGAREAAALMLPSPEAAPGQLEEIRETVSRHQWVGVFKDYQPVTTGNPQDRGILFVPAAGKMMPERRNTRPFVTLLEFLTEFTSMKLRTDLTRLAIRVDEQSGPVVELNFRMASLPPHEEASQ
ncbi:MAG: hypothetical protein R3F07_10290 [Opitutaceae bacterium]